MQDPNVMQWGALDRYQAHFIVRIPNYDNAQNIDIYAQTTLKTKGHFAAKRVTSVSWIGNNGQLLDLLNKDNDLNGMIARQTVWNAKIHIEQTGENIRIHGRWNDKASFGIEPDMFEIYDRIAGHIRASCLPPI